MPSTSGPLRPYPADPEAVGTAGETLLTSAGQIVRVTDLARSQQILAQLESDGFDALFNLNRSTIDANGETLSRAARVAGGVTRLFAASIRTYNDVTPTGRPFVQLVSQDDHP